MAEKWEDIPEYPGCKISSYGRFMRNNKIGDFSGGRSGSYAVILNQNVHSLVAKFFIGERPDSYVINHKDRNKRNNHKIYGKLFKERYRTLQKISVKNISNLYK